MAQDEIVERSVAAYYAEEGLNGDDFDAEERMNRYAYAQVHATIYVGDVLTRIANSMEKAGKIR